MKRYRITVEEVTEEVVPYRDWVRVNASPESPYAYQETTRREKSERVVFRCEADVMPSVVALAKLIEPDEQSAASHPSSVGTNEREGIA